MSQTEFASLRLDLARTQELIDCTRSLLGMKRRVDKLERAIARLYEDRYVGRTRECPALVYEKQ